MSDAKLDLARRAVACKRGRWMPGMLALWNGGGRTRLDDGWFDGAGALPDLDDPATLGCLLALVREAWGRDVFTEHHCDGLWRVHMQHREYVVGRGSTEAEALVSALESAP